MQSSVSDAVGCESKKRRKNNKCNRRSHRRHNSLKSGLTDSTTTSFYLSIDDVDSLLHQIINIGAKAMRSVRQIRIANVAHFGLKAFCVTQSLLFVVFLLNLFISASICSKGDVENVNEAPVQSNDDLEKVEAVVLENLVDPVSAKIISEPRSNEGNKEELSEHEEKPALEVDSLKQPELNEEKSTNNVKEREKLVDNVETDTQEIKVGGASEKTASPKVPENVVAEQKNLEDSNFGQAESAKGEGTEKPVKIADQKEIVEMKEPSGSTHEDKPVKIEDGVLSDSRRMIQELLEDSKETADEIVAPTDSNVPVPRVVSNTTYNVDNAAKTPTNLSGTDSTEEQPRSKNKEEDMKTFAEWKQKVIEEQQQQKENNNNGGGHDDKHGANGFQNHQQGTVNGSPLHLKKQQYSKNFASADCGAKVLDTSPNVQGRDAILQTDRDKYMNIPCDEPKKYVVIELCEPIQLKLVDIGTFELFSSLIENFTILVSDRYPSREWKSLGNFTAKNERSVQSFPISDVMYYKYVRIEYLSHYGKEHYCPVSSVKVFGLTIEVDDDEVANLIDESFENQSKDEDSRSNTAEDAGKNKLNGKNVLTTVTDAIGKIANKIIGGATSSPGEGQEQMTNFTEQKLDNSSESEKKGSSGQKAGMMHPMTPDTPASKGPEVALETLGTEHIEGSSNVEAPRIKGPIYLPPPLQDAITLAVIYKRLLEKEKCIKYPIVLCDEDYPMLLLVEKFRYMYILSALTFQCCLPDQISIALKCNASELKKSANESLGDNTEVKDPAKIEVKLGSDVPVGTTVELTKEPVAVPDPPSTQPVPEEVPANTPPKPSAANDEVPPVGATAQKESLIMRLRNKVRELEFNMSLSSQYLEELSRRYKKQMDEITAKHNKTLTALISTNEEAASRDVKHSQRILELEELNSKLETKINHMEQVIDDMNNSLVFKHVLMILAEFLIFMFIVFFWFGKYSRSYPNDYDNGVSPMHLEELPGRGRSRSEHRISERSDSTIVKRSYSELNLQSVEDLIVPLATPFREKSLPVTAKTDDDIFTIHGALASKSATRRKKSKHKRRIFGTFDLNSTTSNISSSYTNLRTNLSQKIHMNAAHTSTVEEEQRRRDCLAASKALSVI